MASKQRAKSVEDTWPASKTELWPLERIIPYDKNPRQHSAEQVDLIARSMVDDGVTAPILVDENGIIIYGHGRRLAAEKNAFARYPVVVARGWSEQQKRAARIKDNSYALLSTWSPELLRLELSDLSAAGYEMPLLGFDEVQLVSFLSVPSGADPERTPEPLKDAVSRTGDVWQLGKHRLLCGDSTKADDVASVLDGKKPHLMVTDPPYGVDFDPTWRKGSEKRTYMVDRPDKESTWFPVWKLFEGEVVYIWHGSWDMPQLYSALTGLGFEARAQIIWDKDRFIIGRGHYCFNHEPCFYGVRKGGTGHWQGARDQPTIWRIKHGSSDSNHGAQKPVECMRRPIENSSKPGDYIYEPFAGSGTTIIAAEMMNRYCLAIELSPIYVDVCVQRWQEFSKGAAVLVGDGRTFAEIAKDRAKKKPAPKGKPSKPARKVRAEAPAA